MAAASSLGTMNAGKYDSQALLGDIGVSTWHTAKSASLRMGATCANIGEKSQPSVLLAASATASWMSRSPVAAIVKVLGPCGGAVAVASAAAGGAPSVAVSAEIGGAARSRAASPRSRAIEAAAPATIRANSAQATLCSSGDRGLMPTRPASNRADVGPEAPTVGRLAG